MQAAIRVACFVGASALLVSCAKPAVDPVHPEVTKDKEGPQAAQIEHDLIGREVFYFYNRSARSSPDGNEAGIWKVAEGEIKDFEIVRRFPNLRKSYGDRTDEVHALVTLAGTEQKIRGVLAFQYILDEKGWYLLKMGPRDGDQHHDFSFERIRLSDGKVIAPMSPANPPTGPWRFPPRVITTPIPQFRER
jgi:hypothetical protein